MALPDQIRQKIVSEAARRGVSPTAAIEAAERLATEGGNGATVRPVAERLLIGFLPFVKVRELRELWLGLDDRVADDEMMCGDFALKHGGELKNPRPDGAPEDQ